MSNFGLLTYDAILIGRLDLGASRRFYLPGGPVTSVTGNELVGDEPDTTPKDMNPDDDEALTPTEVEVAQESDSE